MYDKVVNLKIGDVIDTSKMSGYTHPIISMVLKIETHEGKYLINSKQEKINLLWLVLLCGRGRVRKLSCVENDIVEIIRRSDEKISRC